MISKTSNKIKFIFLLLLLIIFFIINIRLGSIEIPLKSILASLTGGIVERESWKYIIIDYRLPKAFMAIITGGGLALSGLLMQTLFRNPLAGPFVLGISSGASLGVAFVILGGTIFGGLFIGNFLNSIGIVLAASLGSFLVLITVISVAIRIKDTMALLVIGLMFGSITTALVSVLAYFSNSEKIQQYIFWSFGSIGNIQWSDLLLLSILFFIGLIISVIMIKSLDAFLLGENYAQSLGVSIKKSKLFIIIATSILSGAITAFAGPIAFIGVAVPHLTKQLFNTTLHYILVPAVLITGAILMLFCDTIAQLPNSEYTLPINAITSIIGAPIVIWLLVKKQKIIF